MEWTAILTAAAALGGALGSQAIGGRHQRRTKRLELVFQRKADNYERVLEALGPFAMAPGDEAKWQALLAAIDCATLLASEEVKEALIGKTGLNVSAERLRVFEHEGKGEPHGQATHFYDAARALGRAMAADLEDSST